LSCIYDSQGAIVSATTCGYEAYNSLCRTQPACAAPGSNSCAGFPGECFTAGANLTCPAADAGAD
jgi:hypothetical protein